MSAIMSCTNWYLPISWPNVLRSFAYLTDASRQARTTPTAPAATVNRPWSSECMAILKPSPSAPTRFSAGTCTLSKNSSPVDPAQTPSLFGICRASMPSQSSSMMNAEMPLWAADGSVFANTRQ